MSFFAEVEEGDGNHTLEIHVHRKPISNLARLQKANALRAFTRAVEQVTVIPKSPSSSEDWSGLAEVAFWLGHLKLDGTIRQTLETIPYDSALASLNIKDLANVVFGVSQTGSAAFQSWRTAQATTLRERFLRETESLEVELSSQRAFVRFLVEVETDQSNACSSGEIGGWHEQTMRRVNTLHALFPHAEVYASQGVGLDVLPFNVPHDPTHVEMPARNFTAPNAVRFNATFNGLVKLRHARPVDWADYLHVLLEGMKNTAEVLKKLQRGLDKILEKRGTADLWQRFVTEEEWNKASSRLTLPHLPKCAVDEWGFASDGRANGTSTAGSQGAPHAAALTAYRPFLRREWSWDRTNILNGGRQSLAQHPTQWRLQQKSWNTFCRKNELGDCNRPMASPHCCRAAVPIYYERKTDCFLSNSCLWICRSCGSRGSFFGRKEVEQSRFRVARSGFDFEVRPILYV